MATQGYMELKKFCVINWLSVKISPPPFIEILYLYIFELNEKTLIADCQTLDQLNNIHVTSQFSSYF